MTTNGHPTHPPATDPAPVTILSRRVFVEVTTTDGTREVWEPTDQEMAECGWVRPELAESGDGVECVEYFDPVTRKLYLKRNSSFIVTELLDMNGAAELAESRERDTEPPRERSSLLSLALKLSEKHTGPLPFDGGATQRLLFGLIDALEERRTVAKPREPLRTRLTELTRERQELDARGGVQPRFVTEAMFDALVDALQERLP